MFLDFHHVILPLSHRMGDFRRDHSLARHPRFPCCQARRKFEIYDWKHSTKVVGENGMPIPDKYGKRAFAPISHVADTTFNHYALQLSIYRYILATKIRNRGAGRLIQASSTPTCGATMWWTYPISKEEVKALFERRL